jgi:outer membrane protein OmpA-like peptidoglycan-associated protein
MIPPSCSSHAVKRLVAFAAGVLAVLAMPVSASAHLTLLRPTPSSPATFYGHGGYSTDGASGNGVSSTLQVDVPAGSTVEQAYLYGTALGAPATEATDLDGTTVTLEKVYNQDGGAGFATLRADVTAQIAAKVGSGGGVTNFTSSGGSGNSHGIGLVVIYSNPASPEVTIAVLDGGADPAGDTARFAFAAPLDKTVPGFRATLALGIGFSYQSGFGDHACGGSQTSRVDVNGARLTSCAGGADDSASPSLVTVGGVGDSTANPADPNATNSGTDDELYDLAPLVSQNDTQLTIDTANPSGDDNVFVAVVEVSAQATVGIGLPVNTVAPAISGALQAGTAFTAGAGTWTGTGNTYGYQLQRCATASAASCVDIPGATSLTYTPVAADVDHHLRLVVTATDGNGSSTAASALSSLVQQAPPAPTAAPAPPAAPQQGVPAWANGGTWTGTGTTYAYQYQRCATESVSSCVDIPDATSLAYTPVAADVGGYLRVVVTATNSGGTTVSPSLLSDRVLQAAPANAVAPSVSGPLKAGVAVAGDAGRWTGTGTSLSYQWQRCATADPASCADIDGATSREYTPARADAGAYVRFVVTAVNDGGARAVATAPAGPVADIDQPAVPVDPPAPADTTDAPVPVKPVVAVSTVTQVDASAGAKRRNVEIGCAVTGARIKRCRTTLYARVHGRRVVVGRGVVRVTGEASDRRVTVENRLTKAGRRLVARAGGVKVMVRARVSLAGSGETVVSAARTRLVPPKLLVAPADGLFAVGSAVIGEKGLAYLRSLRRHLDGVKRIECVGYTDSQGTWWDNQALGRRRADAACRFLGRGNDAKLRATSRGEADPRATNITAAGRALNRRVEIHLDFCSRERAPSGAPTFVSWLRWTSSDSASAGTC